MEFAEKIFKQVDTENRGALTEEQVFKALGSMGTKFTPAEIKMLVNTFDDNGNKVMELSEFKQLCYVVQKVQTVDLEHVLFYAADLDQNGTIEESEFLDIMKRLNVKLPDERLIAMAQKLGGEKVQISYDKFAALMAQIKKLLSQ